MNTDTGREGRHRADKKRSVGARSWDQLEDWSREASGERKRFRLSALKEPRVLLGILTAGALTLGGAHMATSMTPREEKVTVNAVEPGPQGAPETKAPPEDPSGEEASLASPRAAAGSEAKPHTPLPSTHAIVVHVVGAVENPRVVELTANARVGEALEAAGGATEEADLGRLNLARVLSDGEQVFVPREGEDVPATPAAPAIQQGTAPGEHASDSSAEGELININTATESELEELPGVGPAIAARIVEHRTANGAFTSVEQLQDVKGIGPAIFENLRERITV